MKTAAVLTAIAVALVTSSSATASHVALHDSRSLRDQADGDAPPLDVRAVNFSDWFKNVDWSSIFRPATVAPTLPPATTAPVATPAPSPTATTTPAPATPSPSAETAAPDADAPAATTAPPTTPPATTTPPAAAANRTNAAAQSAGCGKAATMKSGTFTTTINGKERQYTVRVPTTYDASKPYRFVLAFHWLGGTMQNVAGFGGYYGLQSLSAESTIFVAPQGLNNAWPNSGGEDLAFVDYLVRTVDAELCVDQNQRFATGFSYGGSMTHTVACSRAAAFRAVAVLSGGQFSGCSGAATPIAYLLTHGVSDTTIDISQARSMRDKFVKTNGCTPQPAAEPAAGSGTHIKTAYQGCSAGHPVVYIPFDGGHTFSPADKGARSFAPTETWNFFSQFA